VGLAGLEVADPQASLVGVGVAAQGLLGDVQRLAVPHLGEFLPPLLDVVQIGDGVVDALVCHAPAGIQKRG